MDNSEISATRVIRLIVAVVFVVGLLIVGCFAKNSFVKVDPGNAGVVIEYGSGTSAGHPVFRVASPGSYTRINPFTEKLVQYSIATHTLTMVHQTGESKVQGDDSFQCHDKNGIQVNIDTTTQWRVDPEHVGDLYISRPGIALVGDANHDVEDLVVRPDVRGALAQTCSEYTYEDIFGNKRAEFSAKTTGLLRDSLNQGYILLNQLDIRGIILQQAQQDALAAVATAQQQAQAAGFLQQKATSEQDAAKATALGQKAVAITNAEAQAESIRIINEQLANSPAYLNYLEVTKWNGVVPSTIVGGSNGQTPSVFPIPVATPSR